MKKLLLIIAYLFNMSSLVAQGDTVSLKQDSLGIKLLVNGNDFMINGMNWDYIPIGTNYSYNLWNESDEFIKSALDAEMPLLKDMGVNALRLYQGIPPQWVEYIFDNYGIYTMLNHSFGRYGMTINEEWISNTQYGDSITRKKLLSEVTEIAKAYMNTRGILMFLLGNENNYGLFWEGAETENIPAEDSTMLSRAEDMYLLFNEAAIAMKLVNSSHPIAICNGDLLFIDIIAKVCSDVDIFGVNMYRGSSFVDAFDHVKSVLDKPIMFTELGADAFNAIAKKEDQKKQAYYLLENWKEVYLNAAGLGLSQNCVGGFTFQFSDGWWKYSQTKNLDNHDIDASWANAGYPDDFIEGQNNMNEEWFGVCAKGPTKVNGLYDLQPRASYYALRKVHQINPYNKEVNAKIIENLFEQLIAKETLSEICK